MSVSPGRARRGVGIIGLGMASLPHAKSLLDLAGRVEVHAAFSPSASRRAAFQARFNLPVVNTLAELIDDQRISMVLLLTPPDARRELVAALAARGKHILMEKPVERTTAASVQLVDMCEAAGVHLGIVLQTRFRDASMTLKRMLVNGELGDPVAVDVRVPWWRDQAYYDEPGRGSYARDGGGVLISQAIHSLDLMLHLAGPVTAVRSLAATTAAHRMQSEDFVAAGLHFASGAAGALMATTAAFPGATETLEFQGTQGTARLSGPALEIWYRDGRQRQIGSASGSGSGADPMDFPHCWHRRLLEAFLDALDRAETGDFPDCYVSGREALAVHHLIDALLAPEQLRITTPAADRQ